jgi:hypothetical protein
MDTKTHATILNTLTTYDRRYNKRNPYALGHYAKALNAVRWHVERGQDLRTAIVAFFTGKLCDRVLKSVGLELMTDSEARHGGKRLEYPDED